MSPRTFQTSWGPQFSVRGPPGGFCILAAVRLLCARQSTPNCPPTACARGILRYTPNSWTMTPVVVKIHCIFIDVNPDLHRIQIPFSFSSFCIRFHLFNQSLKNDRHHFRITFVSDLESEGVQVSCDLFRFCEEDRMTSNKLLLPVISWRWWHCSCLALVNLHGSFQISRISQFEVVLGCSCTKYLLCCICFLYIITQNLTFCSHSFNNLRVSAGSHGLPNIRHRFAKWFAPRCLHKQPWLIFRQSLQLF